MIKVIVWTSITAFFIGLLKIAVFSYISFIDITPDFILLIVIYASISNGSRAGMICGFISGLLIDFLSAAPLGLSSFIFVFVGFTAGKLYGMYNLNKIVFPCLLGLLGFLFKVLLLFALNFIFGKNIHIYNIYNINFFLELLLNTVFSPIIFFILNLFPSIFKIREFPVL